MYNVHPPFLAHTFREMEVALLVYNAHPYLSRNLDQKSDRYARQNTVGCLGVVDHQKTQDCWKEKQIMHEKGML